MRVCVFCGSRPGVEPSFMALASELGAALARAGHVVVYGGASVGLMGALADAALAAGGEVVGIIPSSLVNREVAHPGLSDTVVVDSLAQRKTEMVARSDVFVTLPGGIGTLDELFEVWTMRHLGLHRAPLLVVDPTDYYAALTGFLHGAVEAGFLDAATRADLEILRSVEALCRRLGESHM